jgi:hypothetical protein
MRSVRREPAQWAGAWASSTVTGSGVGGAETVMISMML